MDFKAFTYLETSWEDSKEGYLSLKEQRDGKAVKRIGQNKENRRSTQVSCSRKINKTTFLLILSVIPFYFCFCGILQGR